MASDASTGAGQAKLDAVTTLLDKLSLDLKDKHLKPNERDQFLEQLKVFGRDPSNADPIFTKQGVSTLAQHAFESNSPTTSREALRCLANALLLKEATRQILVDCGAAPKLAEKLKTDSTEDEFLVSRILFLLTYGTNVDFEKLIKENGLADSVNKCISRHAKRYSSTMRLLSHSSPMDDMALNETAKLIFNITHFYPDLGLQFSKSIPPLVEIMRKSKIRTPPLDPPLCAVINALINLDLAEKSGGLLGRDALFPALDQKGNAEHLINILDAAISSYTSSELEQLAAPVITLIRKVYQIAPENVKKYMEFLLLPTDAERNKPLGKSDTLSSRLLNLSSSSTSATLRNSIYGMLFELSGENADTFVRNVGYGFAAGFLMSQNMPIPQSAGEAFAGTADGSPINPITGQKIEHEPKDEGPPMTKEEKEREAERLFVLFERLKKTGVVDVENPVAKAMQEGRFEELPDDYDEEDEKP
ncbi:uncharacterized protein PV09_04496 [Verruconis gallopava]|uniref:Synembryn-A n=1 Tax=Verruconis gallopava TaxID=253628 RepID=A0A0D2ACF4_9PEZI|nr:uncharacterized protein PV09_04496 [Verruconis gallopava]KIW04185.1 hypothetical protein PV09_04496 [Verruconis gallopava]